MYIHDIQDFSRKQKTLTEEELQNMIVKYKGGQKDIKDDIILGSSGLIISIILRLGYSQNIPDTSAYTEDGIQQGFIIVAESIKTYKESLGLSFKSYISKKIYNYYRNHIINDSLDYNIPNIIDEDGERRIDIEDKKANVFENYYDRRNNKRVYNKIKQKLTRKELKQFINGDYSEIKDKLKKIFIYYKLI